jgi:hypothetical protein
MTICKYFLSGRCHFGKDCRYEHPSGNQSKNALGKQENIYLLPIVLSLDRRDASCFTIMILIND